MGPVWQRARQRGFCLGIGGGEDRKKLPNKETGKERRKENEKGRGRKGSRAGTHTGE
jgi:hypothetical protein